MSMSKRDKERQLVELSLIVTGIRLFNKECGKGGEGIDDCNFYYIFKMIFSKIFLLSTGNLEPSYTSYN